MEGRFIQISPDGKQAEGVFFINRPGRVRFHYNPPSHLDITASNGSVAIRDRRLDTQDMYPLSKTPLRYLLASNIDLLRAGSGEFRHARKRPDLAWSSSSRAISSPARSA